VAETRACIGVSPEATIISSSRCSKKPWKRPAGPLSVPKAIRMPARDPLQVGLATRFGLYFWPAHADSI
jgi:hypothetical protein